MSTKRTKRAEKRRGRPKGSKTADRHVVLVRPAACPTCGSTERSPYRLVATRSRAGTIAGSPYTRIVYRDCRCLRCGKPRRETHFENAEPKFATQTAEVAKSFAPVP